MSKQIEAKVILTNFPQGTVHWGRVYTGRGSVRYTL